MKMMCEACELGDHANCGMQTWCRCECLEHSAEETTERQLINEFNDEMKKPRAGKPVYPPENGTAKP